MDDALQDHFAPKNTCYGCGPSNPDGFQIKSHVKGDRVVAQYHPKPHHRAFPNVLCGGVIGTLLDCHCAWAGSWFYHVEHPDEEFPSVVTAFYGISLKRPCPMDRPLLIEAHLEALAGRKINVAGVIRDEDTVFAACEGRFVAVKPGHPAYGCWR